MRALGVDIGNGYAFASFADKLDGDPTAMLPAGDGAISYAGGIPSDVYVTPPAGEPLVVFDLEKGAAGSLINKDPKHGLQTVKKRLHEQSVALEGIAQPVSLDAAYAAIARDVVVVANQQMRNRAEEPVYDLVVTYPVSYEKNIPLLNRMTDSIESIIIDDHHLNVLARLPEPAAAAIDYLYYRQHVAPEDVRIQSDSYRVLVYDLGHGTCDIALVEASSVGKPYTVLDQDGHPEVGGSDFEKLLFDEAIRCIKKEYDYEVTGASERERLKGQAVKAKISLSRTSEAELTLLSKEGEDLFVSITKNRYEELIYPKLFETMELAAQMLARAETMGKRPDAIILTGGASRTPLVEKLMREVCGDIPVEVYRASEAVSFGAARFAQYKQADVPEPIMEQLTLQKFGYLEENVPGKLEGNVYFVLDKGVKLPAQSEEFTLNRSAGRRAIRLFYAADREYAANEARPNTKDCEHLLSIPFDIPAGVSCKFSFVVEEDKNITVKCTFSDGTVITKSTADTVQDLVK